ncbi:DUF3987 domain-containing protein [Kocuria sp. U4B]
MLDHDIDLEEAINEFVLDYADETPVKVTREWPELHPDALQGLPGRIVRALLPTTEAAAPALLAQVLAIFAAHMGADGSSPHLLIANDPHHARMWPVVVGTTSAGAKGTSWSTAMAPFHEMRRGMPNPVKHVSGLSSGEGLIESVRDDIGDPNDSRGFQPGVDDKRALVKETELAAVFRRLSREGNTLGPVLRQAWDGDDLSVMTKTPIRATSPHIVVVGHVSPEELKSVVRSNDVDGGTLNRFLFFLSRRSKRLPDGGNAPRDVVEELGRELRRAVEETRSFGTVRLTDEASALWARVYYHLTADRMDNVVTKATGRRAPQVKRLALIYALMDRAKVIDVPHLRAALAVEEYSTASARWIFSTANGGDQKAEGLLRFIADAPAGRLKSEITKQHFKGHIKAKELDALLQELLEGGRITQERAGRGFRFSVA